MTTEKHCQWRNFNIIIIAVTQTKRSSTQYFISDNNKYCTSEGKRLIKRWGVQKVLLWCTLSAARNWEFFILWVRICTWTTEFIQCLVGRKNYSCIFGNYLYLRVILSYCSMERYAKCAVSLVSFCVSLTWSIDLKHFIKNEVLTENLL